MTGRGTGNVHLSKNEAHVPTQHQLQHVLIQKPEHLADVTVIFGSGHHDPESGHDDPGSGHHDPELYYAYYLRSFDELDPDSAVDRVKDEGRPFTRRVMLLTVLTDRLKRPKQRFFHSRSCLLDLIQKENRVSIA